PFLDNENQIEKKVTYANTDPYWGWTVAASTYMLDFNEPAKGILNIIVIVIGLTMIIGIPVTWILSNRIAKPITMVTEHMNNLANGDLTGKDIQVNTKDETGILATAMNHMQERLRDIIFNVSEAAESMSSQSEELTQAAGEVGSGA